MMNRLSQVETLRMVHNRLELELAAESSRPHPDVVRLNSLKREKLRIKDQMQQLMRQRLWPSTLS